MAQLALSIVVGRMRTAEGPFTDRLALLQHVVRDTLADLETLVRAEAVALGVAEADVEEHVGVAVGLAARRAVEVVLEEARRARVGGRRAPGTHPDTK